MADFDIQDKGQFLVVICPYEMTASASDELGKLIQVWLRQPKKAYIFDFKSVGQVSAAVYKSFVLLQRALRSSGGRVFSANLNKDVARQVSLAGMEGVFGVVPSIESAMASAGLKNGNGKPAAFDVNLINPFLGSAKSTIELQAGCKVAFGKPRMKKKGEVLAVDLAGVISLQSTGFSGSIALCFPEKTFLGIYGAMLGETVPEITDEIQDGAGELLNIIFGQAKAILNDQKGYSIQKALPSVIRGQQLQVHHMGRDVAVILPFTSDHGEFHIEISVESSG